MKQDFSADETQRNHQQLGLAHIALEKLMVDRLAGETVDVYGSEFICWLHREFYQRLPESLHWAKTMSRQVYRIESGRLRDFMVDVANTRRRSSTRFPDSSAGSISSTVPRTSSQRIA